MKTLLFIRHAKSSWDDNSLDDHERPLALRGKQAAPIMRGILEEEHLLPELILASTAKRAQATADLIAVGQIPITSEEVLYFRGESAHWTAIRQMPDAVNCLTVIGHNPDLENIIDELAPGRIRKFRTCAIAAFKLSIDAWSQAPGQTPELIGHWYPKMFGA